MNSPSETILAELNGVKLTQAIADRFWSKVAKKDGCWEWMRRRDSGYGVFKVHCGGRVRYLTASRVAYVLTLGPVPDAHFVCHRCDNPPCCNPEHLFAATLQENFRDMMRKGRSCRGEDKPSARLTEGQVLEIREKYRAGCWPSRLAVEYRVSASHVKRVAQGKKWKHLK